MICICYAIFDIDREILFTLSEINGFEILIFDEIIGNGEFELSLFGDSVSEPEAEYIEMKVGYSSSKVMFNELGGVSFDT